MNDLTVLHLSDLHIDGDGKKYSELLKALLQDIATQLDTFKTTHFVLVITGDIINQGNKKALNNAKKFFKDLKEKIGHYLSGIYIVPGNHDKYRTDEGKLLIPAYRSYFENIYSYLSKDLDKKPGFDDSFFDKLWHVQKESYDESGYNSLIAYVYDDLFPQFKRIGDIVKNTFGVDVLEIDKKKYCFVLFNTAWSCIDDYDNRHILVGEFQLKEIKKQYDELTDDAEISLTLSMGHHPLNNLYGNEQDTVFDKLIFREGIRSEAYLCGHTHDRDIINWSNTNQTMYTLMTGIGWPDKSATNANYHYYSIYNFNLELNSFEIYVRSTRDTVFRPDLSIYGENEPSIRLIRAIRPNKDPAIIAINTSDEYGYKQFFPSSRIFDEAIVVSKALSKIYALAYKTLLDDLSEFYNIECLDDEEENYCIDKLYDRAEKLIADTNEQIPLDIRVTNYLEQNKKSIYLFFEGFMQKLCQSFSEEMSREQDGSDINFHFRFLGDKASYKYPIMYSSFLGDSEAENSNILNNCGLLKDASVYVERKSLIYSANTNLFREHVNESERWVNCITIFPDFEKNRYNKPLGKGKHKITPFITFDVTIYNHKNNNLLYLLEYYKLDKVLGEILKTYTECFSIDLDLFCQQCKRK